MVVDRAVHIVSPLVSMLTLYSDDLSSNPAEVYICVA